MKRLFIASALLAVSLTACGGGGSNPLPAPSTTPTKAPMHYTIQLHWSPRTGTSLADALRRPDSVQVMDTAGVQTIVVKSSNGGESPYDTASSAYVTASVSPEPSPGVSAQFTTTSDNVVVTATPTPVVPDPSASPAVLIVPKPNTTDSGHTVTATVGADTATDNLLGITQIALVAPRTGAPVYPDAVAYTFDSNCVAHQQASVEGADVYITGPDNATIHFPGMGNVLQHGYDVSTLTPSLWEGNQSSVGIDDFGNAFDDTILFYSPTNRHIIYLSASTFGGSGQYSSAATFIAGYGCL